MLNDNDLALFCAIGDSLHEEDQNGESTPTPAFPPRHPVPKRLGGVLNAGVGGDGIQNIAYRIAGCPHPDPAKHLPGLGSALAICGGVRLWAVQAGTNNLSPKRGLIDVDRDALRALLQSLRISSVRWDCKVLLTGVFPRKDISSGLIDEADGKLLAMVKELNVEQGRESLIFLPPTETIKPDEHLVDHVHLNVEGYRLWAWTLFPAALAALGDGGP